MNTKWIAAGIATVLLPVGLALAGSPAIAGRPTYAGGSVMPLASPIEDHALTGVSAVSTNDIWAVGDRTSESRQRLTWTQHFNGTRWSTVPSPSPGGEYVYDYLTDVAAVSADDAWAVGGTEPSHTLGPLVEHWNGTSWSVVTPPRKKGYTWAVDATGPHDVWMATSAGDSYLSRWNGSTWRTITMATPPVSQPWQVDGTFVTDIEAVSDSDLWAVGFYQASDGDGGTEQQPFIEHWDGSQWSAASLENQALDATLNAIDLTSPEDIWAVGSVAEAGLEGDTLIEHFDGSSWTATTTSYGATNFYSLGGVTALAPDDVWATGSYLGGRNWHQEHTVTEHWDGSSWTAVPAVEPSPHNNRLVQVTAFAPDNVLTVGGFWRSEKGRGLIERWNGSSWTREG